MAACRGAGCCSPAPCQHSPCWRVLCWVGALGGAGGCRGEGGRGTWPAVGPLPSSRCPRHSAEGGRSRRDLTSGAPSLVALQPLEQAGRDQGRVSVFMEAGPQEDRQPERAERGRRGQGGPSGPGRICPPLGLQSAHFRPDGQQRKGVVAFHGSSASGTHRNSFQSLIWFWKYGAFRRRQAGGSPRACLLGMIFGLAGLLFVLRVPLPGAETRVRTRGLGGGLRRSLNHTSGSFSWCSEAECLSWAFNPNEAWATEHLENKLPCPRP